MPIMFSDFLLLALILLFIALQVYFSIVIYRLERSITWLLVGFFFCFGLNIYVYQLFKLEKQAGIMFENLSQEERTLWRRVYVLVFVEYMTVYFIIQPFLLVSSLHYTPYTP